MDNSQNISPDNVMQDRTLIIADDRYRIEKLGVYIISHSVQGNSNIGE